MHPTVVPFFDPATFTFTYVVSCDHSKECAIVDPVWDYDMSSSKLSTNSADKVVEFVKDQGLTPKYILETHAHADHLTSAQHLKKAFGVENIQICIGEGIKKVQEHFVPVFQFEGVPTDGSQFDRLLADSETLPLGTLTVRVMHTPGHTSDSNTFIIGDTAFVGDTMFAPDVGTARCDFPGGDAESLYDSLQKILSLPEDTRLFLCHDYPPQGKREPISQTTIAIQKAENIHLRNGATKEQFVEMRRARDAQLGAPKLLLPSIQLNLNAGLIPPANKEGDRFFKLPIRL
ncbi:hydroxyacylglutathione hydrolase [Cladochytrium replicatum]|nr:hydroxyacylglutathione hydrolase [Cladochytrium replicatum]